MSSLTLLLLQLGFLLLLWLFVFGVVYSLRADLFGVKVRKLAPAQTAEPSVTRPPASASSPDALTAPVNPVRPAVSSSPQVEKATTANAKRIVITSGPKAGLELPLGDDAITIGRSSESGLVIRDDYTSSHHARLLVWGNQWMVQDLDSTNGTYLAGKRVTTPVEITIGAPIKVGATTFELRK